jgi:hypothetical protein
MTDRQTYCRMHKSNERFPFESALSRPSTTRLPIRGLGFGRLAVENIRRQLPDEKFLKKIGGGSFANPD